MNNKRKRREVMDANKPVMKTFIQGIIFGVLAVISGLLFVGIPFGTTVIEIANVAVLVVGAILVLIVGVIRRKYTAALIIAAVYMAVLFALTMFIETNMSNFVIVGNGFVPSLSIATTGLLTAVQQKGKKKTTVGMILNAIGMLISIASVAMTVMNGFIIVDQAV